MSTLRSTSTTASNRTSGDVHVFGGTHVAADVAARLAATGAPVHIVDRSLPRTLPDGVTAEAAPTLDGSALADAGLHEESAVVVADRSDATNLLLSQLARVRFDVDRVVTLLNDPSLAATYDGVDVELVESPTVLGKAVFEQW
jgi:Trk K+ transport system NAD-binding subunit